MKGRNGSSFLRSHNSLKYRLTKAIGLLLIGLLGSWQGVSAQSACTYVVSGPAPGTTIDVGGSSVGLTDDQVTGALPIGFNFNFFGATYSNFYISSNGFISFDAAVNSGCCSGQLLPSTLIPNAVVSGFWEDLNPTLGGTIGYGVFGTAPARRLVVSYTDVAHHPGGNPVTFQIKLYESSNVIEVSNISCPSDGGNHTLGIEDITGTLAFTASGRNATNWASANETTTFTPIDQTAPTATCPSNISISCSAPVSYSVSGTDECQFSRVALIGGLASGATFPTGNTTVTFRARDHGTGGVFNNGAGGTFSFNEGDSPQTIALKACESVYGAGNCLVGVCGAFTYYYRAGHQTCNCGKTDGQYEFVYSNAGYSDVGQDYGGTNAPVNFVPFVRVKGVPSCSSPNTWLLAVDRLGGNFTDCSFTVTAGTGVTPSNAGPDQTVCASSTTLAANAPSVGTGGWSIIAGAGGACTTPSSSTSAFTGVAGTTYTLRWSISGAPCATSTDDVIINLRANPTAANAGPDQSVCGSSATLAGNAPTVGTGAWSIVSGAGGSVTTPSSPTSSFTGAAGTTYTLRWTISNAPCVATTDDVLITIAPAPTTANAGPDQTVCGNSATLAGNTPAIGTASWTIVSGAGGAITTPTSPTSGFTGVAGTTYTLRWSITNPPCAASTDDVIITLRANPTAANAGPDQSICASAVTLAANAPTVGAGAWSIVSGAGGSIITASSPTSSFTGAPGTIYTLRWTISNAPCVATTDDVLVTFAANPTAANAGPDQTICGTSATLAGNTPGVGAGLWTTLSGPGTVSTPASGSSAISGLAFGTPTTLRWTVTNPPCAATQDDVVLTVDPVVPSISCPGPASLNSNVGVCTGTYTYTAPVGTDNCAGASTTQIAGLASGSAFPVGVTTNTFRVVDAVGNSSSCSFAVTVVDVQVPAITCPSNFTANVDPGTCTALIPYPTPVGTDNCSGATTARTTGLPTSSLFPLGQTTCTFVVTDAAGNTASCAFTATIVDNIAPTITCPPSQSVSNGAGLCGANVNFGGPTASDNCVGGSLAQIAGLPSNSLFPLGVTTNTLRVTDGSGNSSSCSFTVTVTDNELPGITCQPSVTLVAATGICEQAYSYSTPSATDNCSGATVALTSGLPSGSVFPVGFNTIKFTATDASGNTSSCSFLVTVTDNELPVITCPASLNLVASPGVCNATATFTAPVGTDNCSAPTTAQTTGFASSSAFPVGTTINTFRVTDASGNSSTCTFSVIVSDGEVPTITCPANMSIGTSPTACNGLVNYSLPIGADNCGSPTIVRISGLGSGFSYPIGTITNVFRATDAAGNTSTCSFTVTVTDNQPPSWINCPANQSVSTAANACNAVVTWSTPSPTDNCSISGSSGSHVSGSTFALGATTVTYTATDGNSNTGSCTFTVTVLDAIAPTALCNNLTVTLDAFGNASTTVQAVNNGSSDNCTLASVTLNQSTFTCSNVGTSTVTLTATDAAGNNSTCASTVTVIAPAVGGAATADVPQCGFNVSCNGASDGVAHAIGSGGCPTYSYLWSNGGTTATITGLAAGTYTVTITDGVGGTHVTSVTLTAPPALQATSVAAQSCIEDSSGSINLTATGGNACQGYTFLWSNGAVTEDVTGLAPGTYTVTVTDVAGCSIVQTETVGTFASPSPTISQAGLVLSSVQAWSSYQWLLNGSNINGANASTYTVTQSGSYSLFVTDANGCTAVSDTTNITLVGIDHGMGDWADLSIYPNPARGEFRLHTASPIAYGITVRIHDLYGKRYTDQSFAELSQDVVFDLSKFAAGTYIVEVVSDADNGLGGQRKLFKLIVQ
jgi:HYR domain/Secretion system C-terminal sorting domain/SprB repeat